MFAPILLIGAGRLGSSLIRGWLKADAFAPSDLLILEPTPTPELDALAEQGAQLNPRPEALSAARTVVLAVKPQLWRAVAAEIAPHLSPEAVVVSVAAGVRTSSLAEVFGERPIARTLPTTAVAVAQGAAAVFSVHPAARAAAHAVLQPVAQVVDLSEESQMDAVIGISGSAPGFFYAFVEAVEAAGLAQGLPLAAAQALSRASIAGAAALMRESGEHPAKLRADVVSPAGTTEAGLKVLWGEPGLNELVEGAVAAAARRARELGS